MTAWKDLFLALPLPESWLRVLLFVTFGLHLLFVLLMLGTAMLGLVLYLRGRAGAGPDPAWTRRLVRPHLGLKSLAVVLGVGPLLIIQVIYSLGFFTATGLFSFSWLAVIPLLILAFLCIELFEHRMTAPPAWLPLVSGVLGVGALLTVPAIFTGALALMERPESWASFGARRLAEAALYLPHWLFRYLHVLGAAVVFGAAFHLVFTARGDKDRETLMRRWLLGGLLFQVAAGVPLLFTVADIFNPAVVTAVTLGAAAAMAALWTLLPQDGPSRSPAALLLLLPVVFVAMLAARQYLQDGPLLALHAEQRARLAATSADLGRYRDQALAAFRTKLDTVYDNGGTIYAGSCQPCHGASGRGDGPAATRLLVKAENLAAIRADKEYVRHLVLTGVPGSAMPYFTVFDADKIDALLDEMEGRFALFGPAQASGETPGQPAHKVWESACATCHGLDGGVSDFGRTLRPEPPDLRRYSLVPDRSLAVITDGYPGTVMQPYRDLPEATRRDLATLCARLRRQ